MASRIPDNRGNGAFGKSVGRRGFALGLRHPDDRSVLFSDHHSGLRDLAASQAGGTPRHIQGMAQLLEPFAGAAAFALAVTLRDEFGSLSKAMAAPANRLRKAGAGYGNACELLIAARALAEATRNEIIVGSPVNPKDPMLLDYVRNKLLSHNTHRAQERLLVIFCDEAGQYILDEEMGWGTADTVRLDSVHLFRRALSLDASSMLLAHNHPSGACSPSKQDIDATRQLATMGQTLGLEFIDHLIVTCSKAYSMRSGGLM